MNGLDLGSFFNANVPSLYFFLSGVRVPHKLQVTMHKDHTIFMEGFIKTGLDTPLTEVSLMDNRFRKQFKKKKQ